MCKQVHGVCIQCVKCPTTYHVMCAARAGYHMEVLQYLRVQQKSFGQHILIDFADSFSFKYDFQLEDAYHKREWRKLGE